MFMFIMIFSINFIYADNGIWHFAQDVRPGVFGADESNSSAYVFNSSFAIEDFLYFNKSSGLVAIGYDNPEDSLNIKSILNFVETSGSTPSSWGSRCSCDKDKYKRDCKEGELVNSMMGIKCYDKFKRVWDYDYDKYISVSQFAVNRTVIFNQKVLLNKDIDVYDNNESVVNKKYVDERVVDVIPSGAVMAFDLAHCPTGWSEFTSARSRVIVGLNPNDANFNSLGKIGGEKTHKLTLTEMPSHSHRIGPLWAGTAQGGGATRIEAPWDVGDAGGRRATGYLTTDSKGSSFGHNNLQPYIALIYCVKN